MVRAIRFLLVIAALSFGWAPVAQTFHAAVAPVFAMANATTQAAAPFHYHDHMAAQMAGFDRQDGSGNTAAVHPAVCAACVGLPAIWAPPAPQVTAEIAETAPLLALVAFAAGPALPPPRA